MKELSIEQALLNLKEDISASDQQAIEASWEELADLRAQITAAEKEIRHIESDTRKIGNSFSINQHRGRHLMTAEDQAHIDELQKQIYELQKQIGELEDQYLEEISYWTRTWDGEAEKEYDYRVKDKEAKEKLEPQVKILQAQVHKLEDELLDLEKKGNALYDAEADRKLAASDLPGKKARLGDLNARKKLANEALVKKYKFDEIADIACEQIYDYSIEDISFIGFDENKCPIASITLINKAPEFDDVDDFSDEGTFDEDAFIEKIQSRFEDDVIGEYEGDDFDLPFDFNIEFEQAWVDQNLSQTRHYYPGSMWRSNGDPGDPPEWDIDTRGDITAYAEIVATIKQ